MNILPHARWYLQILRWTIKRFDIYCLFFFFYIKGCSNSLHSPKTVIGCKNINRTVCTWIGHKCFFCFCFRWTDAVVNWNDTEPILWLITLFDVHCLLKLIVHCRWAFCINIYFYIQIMQKYILLWSITLIVVCLYSYVYMSTLQMFSLWSEAWLPFTYTIE